jgi:alcohol dehydrogenase (cytochrome c)
MTRICGADVHVCAGPPGPAPRRSAIRRAFLAALYCCAALTAADAGWVRYGHDYAGTRYSDLAQINTANVVGLTPAWISQTGFPGGMEATPLVDGGLMFVTGPSNSALAIDIRTGKPMWRYSHTPPRGLNLCCGEPNRGFALHASKVIKVNIENHLVALDAKSGAVLWDTEIADYRTGYTGTSAPLVVKDMVIIGTAGGEFGIRGFVDAYDANTGKRRWRFHTVAGPEDPAGGKSWDGDSWQHGGGATWVTGTYDPELNLVYWGVGNPGPDMNGDLRRGDNLYTCSVVALDVDTGKLKWHFQFTPHDTHDWDAVADPVLVDIPVQGRRVKAVIQANRNGYFYALDRATGKFLLASPYTKISWADGIDASGKPKLIAGQEPSEEGTRVCPGLGGGHNWQPTAYSLNTGLYYFQSTDGCQNYYKTRHGFVEGQWFQLSTTDDIAGEPSAGSLIALDPSTGRIRWRMKTLGTPSAGLLTTAGGLLFAGDHFGYAMALDAQTGNVLWKFYTGAPIRGSFITYTLNGKQYVAIPAGSTVIAFTLPTTH